MNVVYERCCGMDVHKDKIVACILTGRKKETRSFSTMTSSLLELVDWLKSNQCECVAMEATGAYWKPIYNLLELEEILTLVVNAQHIKAVPGRKTDVKDSEWIADLLRHGLLKGSFIPSRDQRELKEIVRYRRSITEERARKINRIQKVLEGANIKLASVVSSIDCTSARKMLNELVAGNNNIEAIANLAIFPLSNKIDQLEEALYGLMGDHQRLILKLMLKHIDDLDAQISTLDNEIKKRLQSQQEKVNLIDGIPGIGERSAQTILAEIGTDMSVFPSSAHLASWAGMCPGNHESAGKRKSGKTRKGNNVLRTTLTECAKAARNSKNTYLSSQYHRIAARRGNNRATVAVGHTILTIAYHILRNNVPYKELGSEFFEQRRKNDIIRKSVNRLEAFGLKVSIEEPIGNSIA